MAKSKETTIMLVGGGTAGHIHPLLAVYSAAKEIAAEKGLNLRFSFIGDPGSNAHKFAELGIPVKKIFPSKLRRYMTSENLMEFPKFIASFFQSLWHVFWEMPDILMSKGGPGSLAPIIAARFFLIPVVIHESDSVPSVTTKLSAKFSQVIFLAFGSARSGLRPKDQLKCEVVGNPLRPSLLDNLPDKRSAKVSLGFDPNKPLMVIVGGSQGSQRINNLIMKALPRLMDAGIQIFHQTGAKLFGEVSGVLGHYFDSLEEMDAAGYRITDFFDKNIKDVFAAADIVVSRAGSSIFEFAALGIPSILIPLPESAQNHQLMNALDYERSGACVVMEEDEITVNYFAETAELLSSDRHLLERMSSSAKSFGKPDAARKIALKLINLA